jgi:hypothetical protein
METRTRGSSIREICLATSPLSTNDDGRAWGAARLPCVKRSMRFFLRCEMLGIRIAHCPASVREWMAREKRPP